MPYNSWGQSHCNITFCRRYSLETFTPSYDALLAVEEGLSQLTEKPMLICWGEKDFCFTIAFDKWERRFPDAEVHAWDDVGHYVIEDVPERLVETMTTWLKD